MKQFFPHEKLVVYSHVLSFTKMAVALMRYLATGHGRV